MYSVERCVSNFQALLETLMPSEHLIRYLYTPGIQPTFGLLHIASYFLKVA